VASLSQGRTAAAQCGLFTHKSVPVIFEPPCTYISPILIINRIYKHKNLLSLVSFLVGLRTYQHPYRIKDVLVFNDGKGQYRDSRLERRLLF